MKEDPTIAELLKPLGYATGQFDKNHFGDKDEFLPTMHGFDEFLAISTTSMPRKNRNFRTIPRTPSSRNTSVREAYSTAGPTAKAARRSRIPGR